MFQCMMEETSLKGDDVVKLFLVISISLKQVWVKLVAREPLYTVGNLLSLSMTVVWTMKSPILLRTICCSKLIYTRGSQVKVARIVLIKYNIVIYLCLYRYILFALYGVYFFVLCCMNEIFPLNFTMCCKDLFYIRNFYLRRRLKRRFSQTLVCNKKYK